MVVIACVPLIACNAPDWRPAAIADAEGKVRQEISDPAAQFTRVQITGDSKTGQTCGYTTANVGAFGMQHTLRFIVYIDATAGPFVEAGMGQHPVSQQDFDRDWQSDCVNEGYRA
jgi:hypothetical protein